MLLVWTAMSLAITAAPVRAQVPSKDLWQIYMNAAQVADAAGDFKIEAIALARAFAFAKQHQVDSPRPVLSQLLLMLAYIELGRKDLWESTAKERLRINVGRLEPAMRDCIATIDRYGWSYYNRWKAHAQDQSGDAFMQTGRLYGAENLFRVEIAFRQKLMADDREGLAMAQTSLALVLSKEAKFRESNDAYNKALQQFRGSRAKLTAMAVQSTLFSVGDMSSTHAEQTITETQIGVMLLMARNLVASSEDSLTHKRDDAFATQVRRALALYTEVESLTEDVRKYWPRQPFFGVLDYDLAWLYRTEFMMTKTHPDRYPDSFSKAKDAFERALAIFEYSKGLNSAEVRNVASAYVTLLMAAGQTDEAKKLGRHYGIDHVN
jgi:tetratricopeptide (TPR) repeat protein